MAILNCAICLNDLMSEHTEDGESLGKPMASTRCGYVFHTNCFSRWAEQMKCCPICRTKVPHSTHNRLELFFSTSNTKISDEANLQMRRLAEAENKWRCRVTEMEERMESYKATVRELETELELTRVATKLPHPSLDAAVARADKLQLSFPYKMCDPMPKECWDYPDRPSRSGQVCTYCKTPDHWSFLCTRYPTYEERENKLCMQNKWDRVHELGTACKWPWCGSIEHRESVCPHGPYPITEEVVARFLVTKQQLRDKHEGTLESWWS